MSRGSVLRGAGIVEGTGEVKTINVTVAAENKRVEEGRWLAGRGCPRGKVNVLEMQKMFISGEPGLLAKEIDMEAEAMKEE